MDNERTSSSGALPRIIGTKASLPQITDDESFELRSPHVSSISPQPTFRKHSYTRTKLSVTSVSEEPTVNFSRKLRKFDASTIGRGVDANGLIIGYWKVGVCEWYTDCLPNGVVSFLCPCLSLAQATHRIGLIRWQFTLALHGLFYMLAWVFTAIAWRKYDQYTQQVTAMFVSMNKNKILTTQDAVSSVLTLMDARSYMTTQAILLGSLALASFLAASTIVWHVRRSVRDGFRIPGNLIEDVCFSLWCPCCVVAQVACHTESYEAKRWNFHPRDVLPGYVMASFQAPPSSSGSSMNLHH